MVWQAGLVMAAISQTALAAVRVTAFVTVHTELSLSASVCLWVVGDIPCIRRTKYYTTTIPSLLLWKSHVSEILFDFLQMYSTASLTEILQVKCFSDVI